MYSSGGSSCKKQRPTTSYLVRPKLGGLRSLYSTRPLSALSNEKRKKPKKPAGQPKMEFRRKPDYADTAYREAVGRLRILMAESYTPIRSRIYGTRPIKELDSAGEETDNQSILSGASRNSRIGRSYYSYNYNPITPRKYYYPPLKSNIGALQNDHLLEKAVPQESTKFESNLSAPPELMSFIERQEDYIEQLEKESRFCKDELSSLLAKVKEVISENEHLHERQKSKLIKSVFDHLETETETEADIDLRDKTLGSPKKSRRSRIIEGPSIVFESRISELEAQLTQAKIDLKKAQEDNELLRKKLSDGSFLEGNNYENFKRQLDGCTREKEELSNKVKTLQAALASFRDKENDTCDKVKRSLDVAEQAQYEKNAADLEIRRLKDELDRQHMKLRDAIADQSRRISDERSAVERRYTQQIEQLTAELGVQWETTNKLQLELDKQRRENADLRRECAQKQALIDELKKDMQNKILTLQSDIGVTGAEKSALEQQISTLNMANERTERQYKQEITRLQAELQSLRQRLDRADADLIHSRRENIRLSEQVASLEKEINLNTALNEERNKSTTPRSGEILALPLPAPKNEDREKELTSMIHEMENKHAATVAELEIMIHSQNQLMDKLSTECHALTRKLEDASYRHKEEIRELQTSLDRLNNRFSQAIYTTPKSKDEDHSSSSNPRNSPSSQAPATSPKILKRSESRSSLKQKSRQSSRQASQEKPPPSSSPQPLKTDLSEKKTTKTMNQPNSQQEQSPQKSSPSAILSNYQQPTNDDQQNSSSHQYQEQSSDKLPSIKPAYQESSKNELQYPSDQQYTGQYQEHLDQQYQQQYEGDKTHYDPNDQYSAQSYDPNQQYTTDPSQQYGEGQYQYDPNLQYDPNQQYESDLNQHYGPNQQYEQNYSEQQMEQYGQDGNKFYADQNQSYTETNQQNQQT